MPGPAVQATMTMTRPTGTCLGRALGAAVVAVTAACGSYVSGGAGPGASGPGTTQAAAAMGAAFGIVQAGPTCPVDSVHRACSPRPLGDTGLRVRSAQTDLTVTTRTNTNGHFFVRLRPGEYVLTIAVATIFPRCPPVRLSVRTGTAVRVDIMCDTGIRLPVRAASRPR